MDKKEFDFVKEGVDTSAQVFTGDGVNKGKSERIREILNGLSVPMDWSEETDKIIHKFVEAGYSDLEQRDFHTGPVEVVVKDDGFHTGPVQVEKDGESFVLDENGNEVFDTQDTDFEPDGM